MATIKSSILTLDTNLVSSGASYNFTLDAEHTNVISNYGLNYAVRYRITPVPGDSQLTIEFWRGQKYLSGGTNKTRWQPAFLVLLGSNYSVSNWAGRSVTLNLDVASVFPNVRITNFKIDGVSRSDFTQTPTVDAYSSVLTAYWVSEPNYVVMPDFTSDSPFEFPGAFSTGVVAGGAGLVSSFNWGGAATTLKRSGAAMAASSTLIAAPGRTALGQAALSSDFVTETEYLDSTYFDGIYVGGFLTATMRLGGLGNLASDARLDTQADIFYSINVQADAETEVEFSGARLVSGEAALSSEFAAQALPGYVLSAESQPQADAQTQFSGGMIRGFAADLQSDAAQSAQASMIYDIGIQYASDWVRVEDDYVAPYYYLGISASSTLWAQALLIKQASGNIQADSTIQGTGGYFQIMGNVIMDAVSDLQMQQFVFGTAAGVLISSPEAEINSDFSTDNITGLLFDTSAAIDAEFDSLVSGGRLVPFDVSEYSAEFAVPVILPEVVTGAQCFVEAETALAAVAGYFHPASAQVAAEFAFAPTPVRLIAIDEYYIDLVTPETRLHKLYSEPRIGTITGETRGIRVLAEPHVFSVTPETKIILPELGSPYLVGRRTRRQAA